VLNKNPELVMHAKKVEIEILEGIKAIIDARIKTLQQTEQKKDFTRITIDE
jgi:hypothetical protein